MKFNGYDVNILFKDGFLDSIVMDSASSSVSRSGNEAMILKSELSNGWLCSSAWFLILLNGGLASGRPVWMDLP